MKHILETFRNQLASMQILDIYLSNESNKIKNFGPKSIEKIKKETGLHVFYNKQKIDVLTYFVLTIKDGHGLTARSEFNVFTIQQLMEELKKDIKRTEKNIEKAKKTIRHKKSIENKLLKIIELTKSIDTDIYDYQMIKKITYNMKDSFYLSDRLK